MLRNADPWIGALLPLGLFEAELKKQLSLSGVDIRPFLARAVRDWAKGTEGDLEDVLANFFRPVHDLTGVTKRGQGQAAQLRRRKPTESRRRKIAYGGRDKERAPYTTMVDHWASGSGDTNLAFATYYFFHATPAYEEIAADLDRNILKTSFVAKFGRAVTVGDASSAADATPSPARSGSALPSNARRPALAEALMALADLNVIERAFDAVAASQAVFRDPRYRAKLSERDTRIRLLRSFVEGAGEVDPLLSQLTALFETPHYADRRALERRMAYAVIANAALENIAERRRLEAVKFVATYAMMFRKLGDLPRSHQVLLYLPDVSTLLTGEALTEPQALDLLRDHTDILSHAGISSPQFCNAIEAIAGPGPNNLNASAYRCAACMSLSRGDWSGALAQVDRARSLLEAEGITLDDRMIKHYLDAIEAVAQLRLRGEADDRDVQRLEQIAADVSIQDPLAYPILIGLYDVIVEALSGHAPTKNHDRENRDASITRYVSETALLLDVSTRDFCFFDLPAIHQRISARIHTRRRDALSRLQ